MLQVNNLVGFGAGGGAGTIFPDMRYELGGTYGTSVNASSYSSSVSIGSAPSAGEKRAVLVFAGSRDNANRTFNSCTVGGVSATEVVKGAANGAGAYGGGGLFWRDDVSSGTTATVTCNWSGEMAAGGFCVVAIYYSDEYSGIEVKDTYTNNTNSPDATYTNGVDGEVTATQGGINFGAIGGNGISAATAGTDFADLTSDTTDADILVALEEDHAAGTVVCTWSGATFSVDGGWGAAFGYV